MNIALPKQERGVSINNGGSGIRINGVKEWGLVFCGRFTFMARYDF